jgi:putative ABC transport system permease protein
VIGRIYRALLVAYPREFRARFADELHLAFVEGLHAARRRGRRRAFAFAWTRLADALSSGLAERMAPGRVHEPKGQPVMLMRFTYDLRMALRQLTRQPAFAAVVILTLALGIGANTAVFSVVDALLVRPLPYREPDQLGFLWTKLEWVGVPRAWIAGGHIALLQREMTTMADAMAIRALETQLTEAGDPEQIRIGFVTPNFTSVLGVQPAVGRPFRHEDGLPGSPSVILLGHTLWVQRFGADPGVVGRRVGIGGQPHEIVGVMGPDFRFLSPSSVGRSLSPDAWVPGTWNFPSMPTSSYSFALLVRAKPGKRIADVQTELNVIGARLDREQYGSKGFGWVLIGVRENLMGAIRPVLWFVQTAALLVLLVAAANVGSLFLVRTAGRSRELAMRAALGAARTRLVRQLAMESTVLASIAAMPAIGLAYAAVEALKAANPATIPGVSSVAVDERVILATVAVTLLAGIVFGLFPLVQLSGGDLRRALQEGARGSDGRGTRRLRAIFVTAQIATALVLITGAVLLIRTFAAIRSVDPGFDESHVVTARVTLPPAKYPDGTGVPAFFEQLLDRLAAVPGVEEAAAASSPPLSRRAGQINVRAAGSDDPDRRLLVDAIVATPGYAQAAGLTLLGGRDFSRDDRPPRQPVAIVDDALARVLWPGVDPVGRLMDVEHLSAPATIVGVVRQAHLYDVHRIDRPQVYLPHAHRPFFGLTVLLRTRLDPASIAPQIRRAVSELDRAQPVAEIRTLSSMVDESLIDRRLAMTMVSGFGAAALVLAAVGLYGLMSYVVSERTREIGIRMTLGAQVSDVRWMILRRGGALAAAGLVIGLVAAYTGRQILETQLYGVSPTDALTLAGAAALLLVVALAACYVPARRAMSIDPVRALRAD